MIKVVPCNKDRQTSGVTAMEGGYHKQNNQRLMNVSTAQQLNPLLPTVNISGLCENNVSSQKMGNLNNGCNVIAGILVYVVVKTTYFCL